MSRGSSSFILFDGINSMDYNLVCSSLSSGLYSDVLVGSRSIKEDEIEGRPSPYFYGVKESPLSFSMRLTLYDVEHGDLTNQDVDNIIEWLIRDSYKTLIFNNNPDKIYYVIFDGQPSYIHNGLNKGYIDLNARSLYPYPVTRNQNSPQVTVVNDGVFQVKNSGKKKALSNINITFNSSGDIRILNRTNNSEISFVGYSAGDTITVDGYNKIATSKRVSDNFQESTVSPSTRWLYLSVGDNNIEVICTNCTLQLDWVSGMYG